MDATVSPDLKVSLETRDELDVLAVRLSRDDRDAFAEIFRLTSRPLARYAARLTNQSEVEDVLQDVFTKLWRIRLDLSVRTSFRSMLYTMVRNRALNVNRRRRRFSDPADPDQEPVSRRPAVDEVVAAEDLRGLMAHWVSEMPPRRAEAFSLSRHDGFKHEEIARIMRISRRTVDTHIVHALRFLRTRLEAYEQKGLES